VLERAFLLYYTGYTAGIFCMVISASKDVSSSIANAEVKSTGSLMMSA
jgi:hypothetical protein